MTGRYNATAQADTYQDFLDCTDYSHAPTEEAQAADLQAAVSVLREQGDFDSIELLFRLAVILQRGDAWQMTCPLLAFTEAAAADPDSPKMRRLLRLMY